MSKKLILYTDGSSRGNPGPAAIGVVIRDVNGSVVNELSESIGSATNNVAEYMALIRALKEARSLGVSEVEVRSDSELLVQQMNGGYAVKSRQLLPLAVQARSLMNSFARATIRHVPREENSRADQLANEAQASKPKVDNKGSRTPGVRPKKPVQSAAESSGLPHYFTVHSLSDTSREQIEGLVGRLVSDPSENGPNSSVKVVRATADTRERKLICELEATSRQAVIDFLIDQHLDFQWMMRAEIVRSPGPVRG